MSLNSRHLGFLFLRITCTVLPIHPSYLFLCSHPCTTFTVNIVSQPHVVYKSGILVANEKVYRLLSETLRVQYDTVLGVLQ